MPRRCGQRLECPVRISRTPSAIPGPRLVVLPTSVAAARRRAPRTPPRSFQCKKVSIRFSMRRSSSPRSPWPAAARTRPPTPPRLARMRAASPRKPVVRRRMAEVLRTKAAALRADRSTPAPPISRRPEPRVTSRRGWRLASTRRATGSARPRLTTATHRRPMARTGSARTPRSIAHWDRLLGGALYAPLSRVDWANLLRRSFDVDVTRCTGCAPRQIERCTWMLRRLMSRSVHFSDMISPRRRPALPPRRTSRWMRGSMFAAASTSRLYSCTSYH